MAQAAPTTTSDSGLLPPPPMLPQPSTQQPPAQQQPFPIAQMLPMPQTTVTGQLPPPLPLPQAATSQPQTQYSNMYPTPQMASLPIPQPPQLPPPTNMLMPPTPQPYFTQFQNSFSHFSSIMPQTGLTPNFNMGLQQNLQGAGQNTLALLQNIATTQMIGSLAAGNMLDPFKKKAVYTDRRRHRSPSPKRRHRSRSDSPRNRRSPDKRNGKRRRNRSPQHKRSSPAKHTPPQTTAKDDSSITLYQPPTPPAHVTVSNPEKTPEYKSESTPTTPDYSARSPTPEYNDKLFNNSDNKMSSNVASILSLVSKNVATVKPSRVSPVRHVPAPSTESRIVSLKKVNEVSPSDSPSPNIKVKSLTDILREQALQSMMKKKDIKLEEEELEERRSRSPQRYDPERSTTDSLTLSNPFASVDHSNFVEDEDSQDDGWFTNTNDNKFGSVVSSNVISEPEEDELLEPTIILTRQFKPKVKSKRKDGKRREKDERKKLKEAKRRLRALKKEALEHEHSIDIASDSEDNILKSDDELLEEGEIIEPLAEKKKVLPIRAIPVDWQRNVIAAVIKKPRRDISRIKFPGENEPGTNGETTSLRESPSTTPDREEAENLSTPEKMDSTDNKALAKSPPKTNVRVISTKRPSKRTITTTKATTTTTARISPKISRIVPNSSQPTSTSVQVVVPQASTISTINMSRVTPVSFSGSPVTVTTSNSTAAVVTSSNVVSSTNKPKGINPFAKVISPGEVSSTQPEKKPPPPKPSSSKRVVVTARVRNVKKVAPLQQPVKQQPGQKIAPASKNYLDDFEAELKLLNAALSEPSTKEKEKRSTPRLDVDNDDDLFDDIDSLMGY